MTQYSIKTNSYNKGNINYFYAKVLFQPFTWLSIFRYEIGRTEKYNDGLSICDRMMKEWKLPSMYTEGKEKTILEAATEAYEEAKKIVKWHINREKEIIEIEEILKEFSTKPIELPLK